LEFNMPVFTLDPLFDDRWCRFVDHHPHASIFHTRGWLRALKQTYGFEPVVYTTSFPDTELQDGIVFCNVSSWLTGRRAVSVPFSDHCQPLVQSAESWQELSAFLTKECLRSNQKFWEIRPLTADPTSLRDAIPLIEHETFCFHTLNLEPTLDDVLARADKDFRRRVRRAEEGALRYISGRSVEILRDFYELLILTRRRHGVPPQPWQWYVNLVKCLGDQLTVRVASIGDAPVAAMLTLRFRETITYKYACSDAQLHHLNGVPLLFWKAFQESKADGALLFDLGRSELDNHGLITFKDRLGADRSTLVYYRSARQPKTVTTTGSWSKKVIPLIPDPVLVLAGRLMYRHVA
jgi:CelD/BcsL family acetyltransferase involved in cellulose biosynthesis